MKSFIENQLESVGKNEINILLFRRNDKDIIIILTLMRNSNFSHNTKVK